jgi:hypothetical protein
MRKLLFILFIWIAAFSPALAGDSYYSDRLGLFVIIPPGWTIDTSLEQEIILSPANANYAYVSIKKYQIDKENQIKSDGDLETAIKGLYGQLGIELPDNGKIDFTIKEGRAVFTKDFEGYDPSGRAQYKKYLRGTICRKADDGQFFYLSIAAALPETYEQVAGQFQIITGSMRITEKLANELYPKSSITVYILLAVIVGLSILFFTRNRRIQLSGNPLGRDSSNFWRCLPCGRMNHIESRFCHRCGAERNIVRTGRRSVIQASDNNAPTPPPATTSSSENIIDKI